jgi:hypothetical protein
LDVSRKEFYRINTSKTMEDFYRATPHFFPECCNIKEQVSSNFTLNAPWKRGEDCDRLSQHSDRVKYGAVCIHVALTKNN